MCVCARSPCNPPSLLVHYSLVTYLLLHTLTWWAPASGCGPGLGCSQPCAQGLLTVQGGSLSQPAAQAPLSSPGHLTSSARLRAGLRQPQHTFQVAESQARWHLPVGTLGVSVWQIPAFFLPGPDIFHLISCTSHLIFPYLRGWVQSLRSECGLLTAAPARVVLAGEGQRKASTSWVCDSVFYGQQFLFKELFIYWERCYLFCIKRNTGYHMIFISWNGT